MCNAKVQYKRLNPHMDNNCEDPPLADSTSKTWSKIMARPKSTPNKTQLKGKNKYVKTKKLHGCCSFDCVLLERKQVILMMMIIPFQKLRMEH